MSTTTAAGTPRETQVARSARTRGALLGAARELFAEKGFASTGREEIAERAGVTRGALYHHFASKTDLAAAVVEQLEGELVDQVVAAARRGAATPGFTVHLADELNNITFPGEREAALQSHADTLTTHLYPEGGLQERLLASLYFVAREGPGLVERLVDEAADRCPGHRVITL